MREPRYSPHQSSRAIIGLDFVGRVGVGCELVRVRVRVRVTIPTPAPLSYLANVLSRGVDYFKRSNIFDYYFDSKLTCLPIISLSD